MSGIEVRNLHKRWSTFDAVKDASFTVAPGTLTVLLGPSGCGKSTTLRLIAGLDAATSGQILIGGKDVTAAPPARRGLAMVFQNYALFPHLSVAENIVFGLKVRRVSAADRARRLKKATDMLGLGALLERKPSQLSGGQQQRVALGRAIVAEAPVCLMDEPLSNLDAQLRHDMRKEIRSIQRSLNMTMVYVTHDQIEAMSLADQVILMRNGAIEQKASPTELYLKPATSFTARFIGTPPMNLLALADSAAGAVVSGSAGPVPVRGQRPGPAARPQAGGNPRSGGWTGRGNHRGDRISRRRQHSRLLDRRSAPAGPGRRHPQIHGRRKAPARLAAGSHACVRRGTR
jgi:sn-glycerol 3-phosphate transport system ATP-binding protein